MTGLTPARLSEIEAAADAATEGPWYALPKYSLLGKRSTVAEAGPVRVTADDAHELQTAGEDAAFIALARTAVPELVAECRRLREALQEAFVAIGSNGANHSTSHPLRHAWLAARTALGDKP